MKTYLEICNEESVKIGFKSWNDLILNCSTEALKNFSKYCANLYAQQAIEAQREACDDNTPLIKLK